MSSPIDAVRFRLRFRTAKAVTSDEKHVTMPADEHGVEFRVSTEDASLRQARWLSIRMGPFDSPDLARADAGKLRDQLLLLGVVRSMGFDFGHDRATTRLFHGFREQMEDQLGANARNAVHGLDIFDVDPDRETRFVSMSATGTVTESPDYFAAMLRQIRAANLSFSERQRVALELINDSLFPASPDAQLLIRVSAMEVVCRAGKRPDAQQEILSALLRNVDSLAAPDPDKASIRDMLLRARAETVGQACRRKVVDSSRRRSARGVRSDLSRP